MSVSMPVCVDNKLAFGHLFCVLYNLPFFQMRSAHSPFMQFLNRGNHNHQLFILRIWQLSLVRLENQSVTFFDLWFSCSHCHIFLTGKMTMHKCLLYTGLCFALCQSGAASGLPRTTSLCPKMEALLSTFNHSVKPTILFPR